MNCALQPALMLAAASAALAAPALLAPAHASGDPRLVERLYDPSQVVVITGKPTVQATITFGEDEHIENVAIGDSSSWQVTPNKRANLLFVKPLSIRASTNMTVVTDRHTYLFDLVARPDAKPLYVLNFIYPKEEKTAEADEQSAMQQGASELEIAAATDPYAVADPAKLNFNWKRKGSPRLMPDQIYDDGNATFITWPADATIPAILIKDRAGTEGPVNYAVRGTTTVVDGVPSEIILRWGEEIATLTRDGQPGAAMAGATPSLASNKEAK
ncbi:TrbG/VirB9 family P-type conjugative transfer protein [Altererythrobacter sp. CC-YST694]|uniref:TrbG/VirB9 family P-type conjugative transfer protein n=1 Tax=Altererythrobacter sp. CC-YST694 TaxID=2755038 RepID=UPI001D00EF5A|nr:TrbG/VirB9 family P-type conjugative transfer protein [Altererythrobacter sp. CC-YST694]